ncbi:MAG: CotH kinase family protein, partial [Flavobacteriales bacterium]
DGLDGPEGIFTNWQRDDEVQAHVDLFRPSGQLVVSQASGMQVDGGLGGSRGFPQHSFRLEFDNDALGDGRVNVPLIPDRPARARYSRIYLRNGSNQFQILPHKDAAQVKMMAGATHSYYAAWTPATVYINGSYFGLYELREKFDDEYFRTLENADADSVDLLSLSAWNGTVLRPTEGSVDPFWRDISAFYLLDPTQDDFWDLTDARFDLTWYTDHIIGQQWMGTRDWPSNNVKVQRSNATDFKWRFCTIDLELALAPNGQSDAAFDAVSYTANQPTDIPYTRIWQRAIENPRFHDHFINRFADVMNSAYLNERLLAIAQEAYDLTRPEMGLQFQRWSSSDTTASLAQYEANHEAFLSDLEQRTPFVRTHIQDFFDLPRQVDVTLDVVPAGAGTIRISTLRPEAYPWEGVYFDGVPIRIEAVANPGYFFTHWTKEALIQDMMDPLFLDTLTANTAFFQANFIPDLPTAVQENGRLRLSVAPNPTTGELRVDIGAFGDGDVVRYAVFDARGQQVQEGTLSSSGTAILVLDGTVAGPYHLQVINAAGERANARFVKW